MYIKIMNSDFICNCGEKFRKEILLKKHISKNACKNKKIIQQEKKEITLEETSHDDKIISLEKCVMTMSQKIDLLDEKLEMFIKLVGQKKTGELINVKKGKIPFDDESIQIFLDGKTVDEDCELIYNYYLKGKPATKRPIRYQRKGAYSYYTKGEWVDDQNGLDLREILADNVRKTYMKGQTYNKNGDNMKYMSRQEYISKLNSASYKSLLLETFTQKYL
jgi:hypothetical protein